MIDKILRSTPKFKGKQRLARWLLKSTIADGRNLEIKGKLDCQYRVPNLIENIGFEIYVNGVYETETSAFIARNLRPNGLLLDIGANIGAIVTPICKLRPDVSAICLEASHTIFEYLKYNVEINKLKNVTLINQAIWNEPGKELNFFSPSEEYGKGSLAPVFTDVPQAVITTTLDSLAENALPSQVNFIKIDVEGFEYYAFCGGKSLLSGEDAPDILFEFVDWAENLAMPSKTGAAQQRLIDFGYSIYRWADGRIGEKLRDPMTTGASLLLATKRSTKSFVFN